MDRSQDSGTARGGRACSNTKSSSPSSNYNAKNENAEEEGAAATVEAAVPPSNSNENENSDEGAGWTYIKRAVLPEEVRTVVTLKSSVPPSNSNANKNENVEERSGDNFVSLFPSILLCNHNLTVPALIYLFLVDISQEIVTARGERECGE